MTVRGYALAPRCNLGPSPMPRAEPRAVCSVAQAPLSPASLPMPEGPEVRRAADRLHEALAGQTIRQFGARTKVARAWLKDHPDAFEGRRVERVWAHGDRKSVV